MDRSSPGLLAALALSCLPAPSAVAGIEDDLVLSVSPAEPTTLDVVEVTLASSECHYFPGSLEITDDGTIAARQGTCLPVDEPATSFAVGPLAAGDYEAVITLSGYPEPAVFSSRFTVTDAGAPPRLGRGPFLRRVPGQRQLELSLLDVPRLEVCAHRAILVDTIEYDGLVISVNLREHRVGNTCAGPSEVGNVIVPLRLPYPYEMVSVVVRYDSTDELGGFRPLATLHTDRFDVAPCLAWGPHHCLTDGRFRVSARWSTQTVHSDAVPVGLTDESMAFWFFRPDNLELFVKVLDACATFDRYWVFISGLTNQGVEIEVWDTVADEQRVYTNPLGRGFESIRDTNAFATCDAGP